MSSCAPSRSTRRRRTSWPRPCPPASPRRRSGAAWRTRSPIRFAADGQVFVLEQGGVIKQFDSINDTTATVWADLSAKVHKFWDRGAARDGARPAVHRPGRPSSTSCTPTTRRSAAPPPTWGDDVPDAARPDRRRLRRERPAVVEASSQGGAEQVLINDWCQQYPSHSDRRPSPSAPTARSTRARGDGASFDFVDYGAGRQPGQPVRRPARRRRRLHDPADRRGRRAALPGPAHRPATRRASTARSSASNPDTGAALPDNPNAASRRPERPPDHRLRAAQPVPLHVPARHERASGSATSAGTTWEEINRIPSPAGAGRELRLALLRGHRPRSAATTPQPDICENLYAAGASASRRRCTPTTTRARSSTRELPDRRLVDLRASPSTTGGTYPASTTARCSSPTTRATASG